VDFDEEFEVGVTEEARWGGRAVFVPRGRRGIGVGEWSGMRL